MKKAVLVAMVAAIFMAMPVVAQEDAPPGVEAAFRQVASFLHLDESQVESWTALVETHRADGVVIKEEMRATQEALDELLAAEEPDTTAIGELVLERRAFGAELRAVQEAYVDGFQSMLDEEQTQRLEFIRRADHVQRIIPAFKLFELIPRR